MKSYKILIISVFLLAYSVNTFACSMYKITWHGVTFMGSNYDAWSVTPVIWFETDGYGAAFTGGRSIGENKYAPQSGMNEFGLSFTRLAIVAPKNGKPFSDRKKIPNQDGFLKDVLHQCKNVDDVNAMFEKYDHSVYQQDIFIFVDKSGKYLIVEPYTLYFGSDSTYVLSNFCPSQITDFSQIKIQRYNKGKKFIEKGLDSTLEYCRNLSDTMHVCREKIGDGTLLTSIWNLNDGIINLYFYHDYSTLVKFDLETELAKGNHQLNIPDLFPQNAEFEKLKTYKTPFNTNFLRLLLAMFGLFFAASGFYFLIFHVFRFKELKKPGVAILFSIFEIMMFYYMFVLATNIDIYYFSAPFKHYSSVLISLSSYIPFLLLVLISPLIRFNYLLFKNNIWSFFSRLIYTLNITTFMVLLLLFVYWRFFDVF
ncbi:MAG: hypothetical protein JXR68_13140 [Bacteroidales bacterium]|nr:hypothetical protein [Bacteroidales bacterium]